jgi:endonuclease/exonuclease/phosphatase family metal-dependent hydrolase
MRLIEKKSGRGFYFYNVHLDHRCQYSREKSIVLITQKIKTRDHNDPVVLLGDFNVYEDNPVINFLKGKKLMVDGKVVICPIILSDSFRTKHGVNIDGGTFNGFGKREKFEKIDYIFINQSAKVLDAEVSKTNINGRFPSDHCPLIALLFFCENNRY